MNLKTFDDQMQERIVVIRKMAKKDVMGARREVDQLRREFVTALTEPMCIETVLLVTEIANELDELDKFDMPSKAQMKRIKENVKYQREWGKIMGELRTRLEQGGIGTGNRLKWKWTGEEAAKVASMKFSAKPGTPKPSREVKIPKGYRMKRVGGIGGLVKD